ncbi:hypothetical protein RQP53_02785 [Paucibacter sp. APW11]|uniref:Uncharacterized protein n=1 Tax=Roseateles aquae TaxID=3077235 RepID=A0ABU3P7C0_9BURK|nr:hypothetical protein [Paucibacter sp. APW11]MDT8998197.1 hypothetical protein [Paucibacter sp. APW11]
MSLKLSSDARTDTGRQRLREPRAAEQFLPLLSVGLQHEYGASALAGLSLTPSQATRELCRQHGLLLRSDAGGLTLIGAASALPQLWQAQRDEACDYLLSWRLDSSEPLFALASADDVPRHLLLPLAPRSALDSDCEAWCQSLGRRELLRFAARQCRWKYLLLGDWASLAASGDIADLALSLSPALNTAATPLQFQRDAEQEALPDGRLAWVYRSPEPLPLAEHSSRRVALSDAGSTPARVLMGALPHGAPRSLQREARAGGSQWVTEIFLIR